MMDAEQKMKEAIRFFDENHFPLYELIKRGAKQRLTSGQVRAGMVRVWERVKAGEVIKPMRLAWQAWTEAHKVQSSEFDSMESNRESLRAVIEGLEYSKKELRDQIEELKVNNSALNIKVDNIVHWLKWAVVVGSIGWVSTIILGVQLNWGVLWR